MMFNIKKIFINALFLFSFGAWGTDDIEYNVEVLSGHLKRPKTEFNKEIEDHLSGLLKKVDSRNLSTKTPKDLSVIREEILITKGINQDVAIAVLDFLQKDEDINKVHHIMSLLNNYLSIV